MIFSILTSKKQLSIIVLLLLCFNNYAQTIQLKDVEVTTNIDSLEKHLQPNQPQIYLNQLLLLERSWLKSSNPKAGSKLEELRLLANNQKRSDILPIYHLCKGYFFIKKRQHTQAFKSFSDALRGFESQADTVGIIKTCQSLTDLNINQSEIEIRNVKAGAEYATRAVKLSEIYGDKRLLLSSLLYLNTVGYKDNAQKKQSLNKQLKMVGNDPKLQEFLVPIVINLAVLQYQEEKNYLEAYRLAKSIKSAAKGYWDKFQYNVYLTQLSEMCRKVNKYDEAKQYLDEVLKNTNDKEFRLVRVNVFDIYRTIYQDKKEFEKALMYSDSAAALQSEIFQTENTAKLNELQVTYKTKEINTQNTALKKENDMVKSRNMIILTALLSVGLLTILLLTVLFFLNKSRKKAQIQSDEIRKLSQIRDQYIKIIAHDLRSPLFAMQGMYDMVKQAIKMKRFDDLERISNFIDESGLKTKNLLDNLLNWGMSQQEDVSYDPQKINIQQSLNEVLDIYEATKALKMFTISVESNTDSYVYADKHGFELILRNLIDNAVKNLPPDKGMIDISVSTDTSNNAVISIQDNGKGITEEKLQVINNVFRKPVSASMGQNGLGLGITLIGKFVQKNMGVITAQSSPNQGSRFVLSLPLG